MLEEAKKKIKDEKVRFLKAYAEKLPFRKNTFDIITVSFGLRNFSNIDKAINEIHRVLNETGVFYCLEFSQINNNFLKNIYKFYSKLIPKYGKFFAGDSHSYEYLIKSIENFENQVELSKKLKNSGFKEIEVFDIIDGVASIHIAKK